MGGLGDRGAEKGGGGGGVANITFQRYHTIIPFGRPIIDTMITTK